MDPLSFSTLFDSFIPKEEVLPEEQQFGEVPVKYEELSSAFGVCRLCLKNAGEFDIFNFDLLTKLQFCCTLHLVEADGLPQYICSECHKTLDICYSFRVKCEENDKLLHEQLSDIKQDEKHNIKLIKPTQIKDEVDHVKVESNSKVGDEKKSKKKSANQTKQKKKGSIKIESILKAARNKVSLLNGEILIKKICGKNKGITKLDYAVPRTNDKVDVNNTRTSNIDINTTPKSNASVPDNNLEFNNFDDDWNNDFHSDIEVVEDSDSDYFGDSQMNQNTKSKEVKGKVDETKPGLCVTCGEAYTSYRVHQALHRRQKKMKTIEKCEICNLEFNVRKKYSIHMRIHKAYSIPCEICGKMFKSNGHATRHSNAVHKKSYVVQCNICGKNLHDSHALKGHMSTVHNPKRNFECDYCHKTFQYKHYFVKHIMIHTGERPHECHVCGKRFILVGGLREHMRLHTGEKPFRCPVCDLAFAKRHNMKSHFKNNHKGMEYNYTTKIMNT